MEIVPWKKIGQPEVLASGYGKSFARQIFEDHNGKATDFYFFEQPAWSIVLALTKQNTVLTITQFKQGAEAVLEELVGGQADFTHEDPEEVIRRELREETGFTPEEVISLGWGWMNSRNSHTKFYCFLATGCVKTGDNHLDESEQLELKERPLEDWLRLVFDGKIVGWDSCFTTMRALPFLNREVREKGA